MFDLLAGICMGSNCMWFCLGAENVAVVYVDAHADINSNITTDTGNMHGMPVAMVALELQKQWEHFPNLEWLQSKK